MSWTLYIENYEDHDFFYLHYKPADAAGEDGNFEAKVKTLEDLDKHIPRLRELEPDVLAVAGDHATPAIMAAHSWHPVPFLLHSQWTRGEGVESFSERSFGMGPLGQDTCHANHAPGPGPFGQAHQVRPVDAAQDRDSRMVQDYSRHNYLRKRNMPTPLVARKLEDEHFG